ncbi:ABC-type multidrug transport system, ATPase and permease component [Georgenia satyanarayanai]|uniref:ABC-type multidrug transport system, ATPase and permease component n=1 Tax=Georgenia satyanarayanai TaxID=860221 RepID=A0A2Y9C351_9MICO|nr:ABC transporter ATP-binding protein [Georgenia satyanarayanai]PYG02340.1 ABC-type multidrug transport system fused ATPase/permease subunit [Georgenia satyanarayanai]SSA37213.1 ABC-type multidrug transport system, ATPase and permease component [Georgenia satyanarayanai]
MSSTISASSELGVVATVRRGLQLSPAMLEGIGRTLALAVVATAGRVVVPVVIQQVTDNAIMADGGPDVPVVVRVALLALAFVLVAGLASSAVNIRLFRASERGLAQLRTRTFRHVHDLSVLTQNAERRGSLVSRVTSDVDTVSRFVQFGGLQLILNIGQLLVATVAMLVYSPLLALVVWLCFSPMFLLAPRAQRVISRAYGAVRVKVGVMLGAISESIVGAETIRAYGASERTQRRIDDAVQDHRAGAIKAQTFTALAFSTGMAFSALALGATVVTGTLLALDGHLTLGQLLAFLFLVQMFTGPVQNATEMLNELQNAVAGWRRVIAVLETPLSITDPAATPLPADSPRVADDDGGRAASVEFRDIRFAYPGGPEVLHGINLTVPPGTSVAMVGETGSGKTTLGKLLTRLMDPTSGEVLLDGTDLRELPLTTLRGRVVLVPQEGFLFDGTIAENIAYGRLPHTRAEVEAAVAELGLTDWLATLTDGLDTPVGQRGESLSAGERQLVAIARAYLADADLLVLDEATSAVDPATEGRISRALARLQAGRTSVAIAHRLSTAEAADLVVVVDAGHVVEVGHHRELVARGGVYARMHASWVRQTR